MNSPDNGEDELEEAAEYLLIVIKLDAYVEGFDPSKVLETR